MRRAVAYHLGSIALGSFVIAIIQFVRLVLNYLDKKTRRIQQESKARGVCVCGRGRQLPRTTDFVSQPLLRAPARAKQSPPHVLRPPQAAAWILCIVGWLVWLLEKIVAFINRNAYIMVAVKGCAGDAQLVCRARVCGRCPAGMHEPGSLFSDRGPAPRAYILSRPPRRRSNYCSSAARGVQLVVANALRLAAVSGAGEGGAWSGRVALHAFRREACVRAPRGTSFVPLLPTPCRRLQVNVVGDALLFLGKLAVAACCGLAAFGLANLRYYNDAQVWAGVCVQ